MRCRKVLPLCAVLIAGAWCMAAANADDADADSMVRRLAERYQQFDSYKLEYLDSYTTAGTYHRKVSFQRPGRYRVETNRAGEANWVIQILSQKGRWMYAPDLQQYIAMSEKPEGDPAFEVGSIGRIASQMRRAEFLPAETIDVAGRSYNCDVVRVWFQAGEASTTLWIDRSRDLVQRYVATGPRESVSVTLLSAEVNPIVPDELFQFEPSPGYREVKSLCCWGPGGIPSKQ